MRDALEAVAEFLVRHGGIDDYDSIVTSLQKMGWSIDEDRPARWRSLIAIMRAELSIHVESINYVFLFERMLQLYVRIPTTTCRKLFTSKLIFHIVVERFAIAFQGIEADVFKRERDVLCHIENIYGICSLIHDKLFTNKKSALRVFLKQFNAIFDNDEPKVAWETFHKKHQLPETTFRRDMRRALWWVEDEVFGKTQIEQLFPSTEDEASPNVTITRELLQERFTGSSQEWRELAEVISFASDPDAPHRRPPPHDEHDRARRRESISSAVNLSETPPGKEYNDRIWSVRLPISTPANKTSKRDSDAHDALDQIVRQPQVHASPSRATASTSSPQVVGRTTSHSGKRQQRHETTDEAQKEAHSPLHRRKIQRGPEPLEMDIQDDLTEGDEAVSSLSASASRHPRKGRRFWSPEEIDALTKGLKLFENDARIWSKIKANYPEVLSNRSNVDIKDKYRNLVKSKRIKPLPGL